MPETVIISAQGLVTIPTQMLASFGLHADDRLIVERTPEGILLRPAVDDLIEVYTDERIAEFTRDDAAVGALLDEMERDDKSRCASPSC